MVRKASSLMCGAIIVLGFVQPVASQSGSSRNAEVGAGTLADLVGSERAAATDGNVLPLAESTERMPAPEPEKVEQAIALVREALDELYREGRGRPRWLVQRLWGFAAETADAARAYAILQEAERVAREAAQPDLVVASVVGRARMFDIDAYPEILASLDKLTVCRESGEKVFAYYMAVARDALVSEEFAIAEHAQAQALTVAQVIAKHEKDEARKLRLKSRGLARPPAAKGPVLEEAVAVFQGVLEERRVAFGNYEACRKRLLENPEDSSAHRDAGFYLCRYREDWVGGLRLLVKSDSADLRGVCERDLAMGLESPVGEALSIAGMWWDLGTGLELIASERIVAMKRARLLYGDLATRLTDPVDQALVRQRLEQAE